MAQHAIDYSPRNASPALHRIDPSEVRLPTAEELRARRDRLFCGNSPATKPASVPTEQTVDVSPVVEPQKSGDSPEKLLSDDTAESEQGKIPEIKEGLIRMVNVVSLYKCVFSSLDASRRRKISDIIGHVAKERDVPVHDMLGDSRVNYITRARQEAFYTIAHERPDVGYSEIGRRMGGKDHTTVTHGIRAHAARNGLPPLVRP